MQRKCTNCGTIIARMVHKNTVNPFCDSKCYGEWQKGKGFSAQGKRERDKKSCSVDGCAEIHFGKGYCRKHYIKLHYAKSHEPKRLKPAKVYECACCGTSFNAYHKTPKYCSRKCSAEGRKRPYIIKKGYRKVLMPLHPRSDVKGYVFEHIVVAEKHIGRSIAKGEEIHHADFNKQNNSPDNLIVCANHAEHMVHHAKRHSPKL